MSTHDTGAPLPRPNLPATKPPADATGGETGDPRRRTHGNQRVPRELRNLRADGMCAGKDEVHFMALVALAT